MSASQFEQPLRVALTTLGCKVNYAEMAELSGALAAAGCDVVNESETADVRVLNSCTVTRHADATTRQRLTRLRRQDPECHLIVTGCSVDANPDQYLRRDEQGAELLPADINKVFDNRSKPEIAAHIIGLARARQNATDAPRTTPPGRARAFIKAQDGCNHRCTYCIVWRARGESRSVPPGDLVVTAREAVAAGHGELVLTGVDLGSYGRDLGLRLADLVSSLLEVVGEHSRLRLSSVNANDVSSDLIALAGEPRLCPHWHMPLQSGSDAVLRDMHRGYRRAQYLKVAAALRQQRHDIEFTTDIMSGFPGESDGDHAATLEVIDEIGFIDAHIFRYSARPDTAATALPTQVPVAVAARRSAELRAASYRSADRAYAAALGRTHEVLIDGIETPPHDSGVVARGITGGYHNVELHDIVVERTGQLALISVTSGADHCLIGRPVAAGPATLRNR